ncbi:hypothetical protein NDU88_011746 [Pleurodeles waltl]|uniref:Uncharacterized protein n=1 Tax=Pleurodeles waltl TaxID=8319 RepID=A0AAV7R4B7_PLEWA|nr:hypothetical protein NDU88_011746 [Pleurodeles waltl]
MHAAWCGHGSWEEEDAKEDYPGAEQDMKQARKTVTDMQRTRKDEFGIRNANGSLESCYGVAEYKYCIERITKALRSSIPVRRKLNENGI